MSSGVAVPSAMDCLLAKLQGITNYKVLKSDAYGDIVFSVDRRSEEMGEVIDKYSVITPKLSPLI